MTKITLTIEASASVIAGILASLPDGAEPFVHTGNAPSTDIGTGIPVAPVSPPSLPSAVAPTPTAPFPIMTPPAITSQDDEDEDGTDATSDLDARGLPWDERIHSGNRKQKADKTWIMRKGVDKSIIPAVENELRNRGAPPPIAMPAISAVAPIPPMPVLPSAVPPAPVAPPMPAATVVVEQPPVPAPVAAPAPASVDMMGLMSKLAELSAAQVIGADYISELTQKVAAGSGEPLNAITDVMGKQHLIDYAVLIMQSEGIWR